MIVLPTRGKPDSSLLGGVCDGLANRLGIEPFGLRLVFALLMFINQVGIVLYIVAWAAMPNNKDAGEALTIRKVFGLIFVAITTVVAIDQLRFVTGSDSQVTTFIVLALIVLLFWQRQEASPHNVFSRLRGDIRTNRSPGAMAVGITLLVVGSIAFLHTRGTIGTVREVLPAIAITLAGTVVLFGSWWQNLLQAFNREQASRIRSQERAEVAAHLHDSVLQTLALIQRHTDNPEEITTLARRQERELRAWLSEHDSEQQAQLLSPAIEHIAATVEERYNVKIEVVSVGDCTLDKNIEAAVAASKEALTNAARFAGEQQIDVFVEVADGICKIFIRDHGTGFDIDSVPEDRRGVRESIIGRMQRHNGSAKIQSTETGTEIELTIPCHK